VQVKPFYRRMFGQIFAGWPESVRRPFVDRSARLTLTRLSAWLANRSGALSYCGMPNPPGRICPTTTGRWPAAAAATLH
jgi:hypothetical protein